MNGVEILASQEIAFKFIYNWKVVWIWFGISFSVYLVIGILISLATKSGKDLLIAITLGTISGVISGALAGILSSTPTEYRTQYKVTVSDEVSMNEFLEKYEIIDQEGKILTIRERNQEDLQ